MCMDMLENVLDVVEFGSLFLLVFSPTTFIPISPFRLQKKV